MLQKHSLGAKKSLGQNFLIDENALQEILEAGDLRGGERVLEIGPGLGILTKELLKRTKNVFSLEIDKEMISVLEKEFVKEVGKGELILEEESAVAWVPPENFGKFKLVANIPYYLTGKILRHFLIEIQRPEKIVLLVQKEMGERICARDGQHTLPSLLVQNFGVPKMRLEVAPESFFPAPKVSSVILEIEMRDEPVIKNAEKWMNLVEQVLRARRKTLLNALHFVGSRDEIRKVLGEIDEGRRAQTLSLEEWKGFWERWCSFNC